jgi:CO/xanthine dehydrogenase Mo-binding subunit
LNPEGIKGTGEGGTMPVPAVIANAVDDALSPLGITVDRIPISPARLRELIARARSAAPRVPAEG